MAPSATPKLDRSDRRRASRGTEGQGETVLLWVEGQKPQPAIFLDESPLGIGVALPDEMPLALGQRVEVVFRGLAHPGFVCSLRTYQDVIRVGLEWIEPLAAET